jgi:hypothetical protein
VEELVPEDAVMFVTQDSADERFCIACGYNLRGLTSEQCPECGLRIDAAGGSAIAWEGRKEMGTVRAFLRTLMDGMFHVKRLAAAVAHPVDARSAMQFRFIISLIAALPVSALFWMIVRVEGGTGFLSVWQPFKPSWPFTPPLFPSLWEIPILWSAGATLWAVLPIGAFITAFLWTGILGYWVRAEGMSQERRKRAVAVSAYVSGPLAIMFVPTLAFGAAWGMWDLTGYFVWKICVGCLVLGFVSCGTIAAVYQSNSVMLISALTHEGWVRKACSIVGLPVCWVLATAVGLVGFPMLIGLVWLMVDSLRG